MIKQTSFLATAILLSIVLVYKAEAFAPSARSCVVHYQRSSLVSPTLVSSKPTFTTVYAQNSNSQDESGTSAFALSDKSQIALGTLGTKMSLIMLVSEYVLKTTGSGLPAGPYGIVGAAEGISYLGVTGLAAFSIYKKIKTGSGLPAGPYNLLGLGEGLSFLALAAGVVVLTLQFVESSSLI